MNGWWRPWSEQANGNHPGEFVAAWRHVVDIFRAQGATNVTWVWCPNIVGPKSQLTGLYPGDNYTDWVCMDGYNWGTDRTERLADVQSGLRLSASMTAATTPTSSFRTLRRASQS